MSFMGASVAPPRFLFWRGKKNSSMLNAKSCAKELKDMFLICISAMVDFLFNYNPNFIQHGE
jgi:hypothetical protein